MCRRFWWGNLRERDHLGRPRRRWEYNYEVGRGCGDWMQFVKDRDRWQALVSTIMNFRVP